MGCVNYCGSSTYFRIPHGWSTSVSLFLKFFLGFFAHIFFHVNFRIALAGPLDLFREQAVRTSAKPEETQHPGTSTGFFKLTCARPPPPPLLSRPTTPRGGVRRRSAVQGAGLWFGPWPWKESVSTEEQRPGPKIWMSSLAYGKGASRGVLWAQMWVVLSHVPGQSQPGLMARAGGQHWAQRSR